MAHMLLRSVSALRKRALGGLASLPSHTRTSSVASSSSSATEQSTPTTTQRLPVFLDEDENDITRSINDCGKLLSSSSSLGGPVKPPPTAAYTISSCAVVVNTPQSNNATQQDQLTKEAMDQQEVFSMSHAKNTTTSKDPRSKYDVPATAQSKIIATQVGNNNNNTARVDYTYLTDIESLPATVTKIMNRNVYKKLRNGESQKVVAVDLKGKYGIELIQIATFKKTYIIDCRLMGGAKGVFKHLEVLLESTQVIKLMHNIAHGAHRISCAGGPKRPRGVLDTWVVARTVFATRKGTGMDRFLENIGIPPNPLKDEMHEQFFKYGKTPWESRPLAEKSLAYAAFDAAYLLKSHRYIWKKFTDEEVTSILQRSAMKHIKSKKR